MKRIISTVAVAALATTLAAETTQKKKHPPQVLEIAKSVKTLLAEEGDAFLTISEPSTDKTVQVAKLTEDDKTRFSLMVGYYPSKEKPDTALPAVGINIRKSWQEEMYEPDTCVQYNVPLEDSKYLSYFIHKIFLKFYNSKDDYKLESSVEIF